MPSGERNAMKTHCKRNHAFTLENTRVRPDGSRECRRCKSEWAAEQRALNRAHPVEIPDAKRCSTCGETKVADAFTRNSGERDGLSWSCRDCSREKRLRWEHGISAAEWDEMFERQGGRCAICRQPRPLHVDHDHETNEIRGLLCRPCNTALGSFDDDVPRLLAAADYLQACREMEASLVRGQT